MQGAMRTLRFILLALLTLGGRAAQSQMPSDAEFEQAVAAARPEALRLGMRLHTGTLWLTLLQARTPMMASVSPGVCHIGYTAYPPRAEFSRLFPPLPAPDRVAWLAGFVRHELAHCAEMHSKYAVATSAMAADAASSGDGPQRWGEVLADLAFALHVDRHAPRGVELIERLATLRAERAANDPGHDSSVALRCYLALRGSETAASTDWLATLQVWRARCADAEPAG